VVAHEASVGGGCEAAISQANHVRSAVMDDPKQPPAADDEQSQPAHCAPEPVLDDLDADPQDAARITAGKQRTGVSPCS
jgi:hypothetical protein